MKLLSRLASLPAAAGTLFASIGMAMACAFHSYVPNETPVDKMLASEHIILARPDPENPSRYTAIKALRGSIDDVLLPQTVDSVTRARLAFNPTDTVLFAREGSYGPWEKLSYLDSEYRALVDIVAARLDAWQYGGDEERYQLFADRHDHPNPDIRRLALQELDRAPYDVLRHLAIDPVAAHTIDILHRPEMAEFMPINLLLLGLSNDPAAAPVLQAGLDEALLTQTSPITGAWATALIELQGKAAIDRLAQRLNNDTSLKPDIREALIESFAIHAVSGDGSVKQRIETALSNLLRQDPSLAGIVARQLGTRADWSQADTLHELMKNGLLHSATAVISVSRYVSFAEEAAELANTAGN